MHCNLRLPDVKAVVLGFNYEVHNALVGEKIPQFHDLHEPIMHPNRHTPNFSEIEQSLTELQ